MDSVNTTDIISNADLLLHKDDQTIMNLGVTAAKIAYYNFQWRYTALIVLVSTAPSQALDTFLSHYDKSVAIKLGKFRPLHIVHIPQYVLFGEDSSDIMEYLKWLMEMNYDNTGKYILICHSTENHKCNETKVFEDLSKILINNVIYLKIVDGNKLIPFTNQVIVPGICRNNKPEKLNIQIDCFNDSCFKFLYPDNFRNLQKCPIIVSTFEQPPFMYLHNGTREPTGGDADILKVVTSSLNATLIIRTPADGQDWGYYEDHNWTGSMGDVFNDRAHLSVCSLPLTSHKYGNFQVSLIYNTMDIVWVAKLPALKPSWEKLLRPFQFHARLSLFATFIFIMILTGFIRTRTWKQARKSFYVGYTKQSVLFYAWVIFLGVPLVKVPSKRALLIIVYSWIWFCFVIRNSYQAALIDSLKENLYQPRFKTFYDVFKRRKYGGQSSYREYFVDEKKIYDNWEQLDFKESHEMLNQISKGTSSFVLAFNKEMVIEHLINHNGTRRLQIIPSKIINSPTVMYLRKYSPLTDPLNVVLSRAVEAGYTQAWHMRFARQKKIYFKHTENLGAKALNLKHFGGCIIITVVGWVVSVLFFIMELYCGAVEENTN